MKTVYTLALVPAVLLAVAPAAEAQQARKKASPPIDVTVKQRSFLDAGTQVTAGRYQGYSTGLTPFRSSDAVLPTGSAQGRLLPGPFGP